MLVYSKAVLIFIFSLLSLPLSLLESSFRSRLIATDQEMDQLRAKVKELQTQTSKHERAQRETARLKGIINNQQQQVHDSYCYRVIGTLWF